MNELEQSVVDAGVQDELGITSGSTDAEQNKLPEEADLAKAQEDLARAQGWKPREEFEGNKEEWVPPEVFILKGKFFKTIHGQKQEIKSLRKAVDDMASLLKQAKEQAIKTTRDELRQAKAQALSDQDHNKVVQIDEQMAELKQKENELKNDTSENAAADNPYTEYYKGWVEDNGWYLANKDMRADADMYGQSYLKSNPGADPEDVFKYVERKIKKEYPNSFSSEAGADDTAAAPRTRASSVVSSKSTTAPAESVNKKPSIKSLTPEEREVALNFARLGVMSIEDYIKNKQG